ncbi:MAG: hypothetical protein DRQ48_00995 [Gammaproteobacteria bacterium]|nr:MAG: hypothetical protein DRQ44_00375 [Gammaproteobacteria bacterium]RKZ72256.1 MAG: hypothetical protein DRQ48_00995 [Gammaproteobacteria bacterium]
MIKLGDESDEEQHLRGLADRRFEHSLKSLFFIYEGDTYQIEETSSNEGRFTLYLLRPDKKKALVKLDKCQNILSWLFHGDFDGE